MASQVFLFLLARNCRMLHLNPASPQTFERCHRGAWSCQTRGCGKPSGSFSGAKLAAVASQVFLFLLAQNSRMLPPNPANPSNSLKRAKAAKLEAVAFQVGAKLAAVASQVFLFLLARNCRMLPPNASSPSKRAKPARFEGFERFARFGRSIREFRASRKKNDLACQPLVFHRKNFFTRKEPLGLPQPLVWQLQEPLWHVSKV